jgi:hypothetical protein
MTIGFSIITFTCVIKATGVPKIWKTEGQQRDGKKNN